MLSGAIVLSRYQMKRGVPAAQLPEGVRQDTRKHTRHVLRPREQSVVAYLGGEMSFEDFAADYRATVAARLEADPAPFDALARLATDQDVYLGCSCPSRANPDVRRCHTWLALELMRERYPSLEVRFPPMGGAPTLDPHS